MTAPAKVWEEWAAASFPLADEGQSRHKARKELTAIPYKKLDLEQPWESFDIEHELTTKGILQFVADYRKTLRQSA